MSDGWKNVMFQGSKKLEWRWIEHMKKKKTNLLRRTNKITKDNDNKQLPLKLQQAFCLYVQPQFLLCLFASRPLRPGVSLTASRRWLLGLDPAVARRQQELWSPLATGDILRLKQISLFVCWRTYLNRDEIGRFLSDSWLTSLLQENRDVCLFCFVF